MKFFHVYNEQYFEGLVKNGLINEDSGFKIQHVFSLEEDMKFNRFAAKGSRLHGMIKEGNYPFYVDRLTGGVTYHQYAFDPALIREYEDLLGKWFLGFQLHESASNRKECDWFNILRFMEGDKGPYDAQKLRQRLLLDHARLPDGTKLPGLSQGSPEEYAALRYPESPAAFVTEVREMFRKRMEETNGFILPCDSYYLFTRMQDELGMRTFMPEVGCQIPQMRRAVALARGIAGYRNKLWGTYYETWIAWPEEGLSMPCFNNEPGNEWYLTQEAHPDDFTSKGVNGGSSRLLQRRIYYYSLMSGADYMAEEWGLNCSYSDMKTFELSAYGLAKKDFIDTARLLKGVRAVVPFAIVLPREYECVQLPLPYQPDELGVPRSRYMQFELSDEEMRRMGHIEDVLKLIFGRSGTEYGNEGHVMTNSRFGDLFDIIYEDAPDEVLGRYEALIDAGPDGTFARTKGKDYRVIASENLEEAAEKINRLSKEILPCTVDSLHWLISKDEKGRRFLSVFNNEGNERSVRRGDVLRREADARVRMSFREPAEPKVFKAGSGKIKLTRENDRTWRLEVPAADFAILEF